MTDAYAIEGALQRVRETKAALAEADAKLNAAREAYEAAGRHADNAQRAHLSAENALLTLANGEPRALIEPD